MLFEIKDSLINTNHITYVVKTKIFIKETKKDVFCIEILTKSDHNLSFSFSDEEVRDTVYKRLSLC